MPARSLQSLNSTKKKERLCTVKASYGYNLNNVIYVLPSFGPRFWFSAKPMTMICSLRIVFGIKQGLWWRAVVEQQFRGPRWLGSLGRQPRAGQGGSQTSKHGDGLRANGSERRWSHGPCEA